MAPKGLVPMFEDSMILLPLLFIVQTDPGVARRIVVAPAETIAVVTAGAGAPVVLIPGLLGGAFGYRHVMSLLARGGHRAIVIEPLGFGASSGPAGANYSLTAQADRIIAVMESLDARHAVVVAHAVGAGIAYRLTLRRPDLVRGLVSIEGGPIETAGTPGVRKIVRAAPWLRILGMRKTLRSTIRRGLVSNSGSTGWVTDSVVEAYVDAFDRDYRGLISVFQGMVRSREPAPLRQMLPRIRCPVILIVGTARHTGGVTAADVATLRQAMPAMTVDTVLGAGLYVFEEQPGAVVTAALSIRP
jgi:pimeloyl-ACP methyl ester carboxylesterase